MEIILLLARLLLFMVFVVAGFAKLADLSGSRQAVRDFGVPTALSSALGTLLPIAEIAIGLALVPVASAWWGAIGSSALLLLYVVAISYNLARGRKPNCHCFGVLYSAPAGWSTLIRNGVLVAIAGFIVWQGPNHAYLSAVSWLTFLNTFEILGIIFTIIILGLLAIVGWFLFHLLRQNGRLLLRIEALEKILNTQGAPIPSSQATANAGLPIGSPAPAFQLSGLYGETLTLDSLRNMGKPLLLIFLAPDCGPCNVLLPEIGRWQHDYVSKLTIALVSQGTQEMNRAKSGEHGLTYLLLQSGREVADTYHAYGTPSAVLVQPNGTIGSSLAAGSDAIRNLLAHIVELSNSAQQTNALPATSGSRGNGNGRASVPILATKVGERAPELKLPDLNGKLVELTNYRGEDTLVVFWNPQCGFCARMLNDLKVWEANPPKGAPQLLFISTGTVEENQAMGLQSPILLDQGFSAGRAFGANGTPSGVLVDAEGNIASDIVVGAPAVLALANQFERFGR